MARPGLTGHRKFKRLAKAVGSAIVARGCLELLWDHCYETGEDYVGTAEDIEAIVGWDGENGALTRALSEAGAPGSGFIDAVEASNASPVARYQVHDLWHHAPDYVRKRRERELARLRKLDPAAGNRRSTDRRAAPDGGQCPPSLDWQDGDGRTPSPSPSPSPGEKSVSPALSAEPPLLVFPTIGADGHEWPLTRAQVAEWRGLFPGLDVLAEARGALAWVKANDRHRKTFTGMPKFLVNWFNRSVNRGTRGAPAPIPFTKTAGNLAAAERFVARGQK